MSGPHEIGWVEDDADQIKDVKLVLVKALDLRTCDVRLRFGNHYGSFSFAHMAPIHCGTIPHPALLPKFLAHLFVQARPNLGPVQVNRVS